MVTTTIVTTPSGAGIELMSERDIFAADDEGVAPAVFGAEQLDEDEDDPEPVAPTPPEPGEVFVLPSEPVTAPQSEVTVQLGRTEDGELVLLAFSSPERLASCLGDEQPWVAVPKPELEQVRRNCEAEILEIDPVRPAEVSE